VVISPEKAHIHLATHIAHPMHYTMVAILTHVPKRPSPMLWLSDPEPPPGSQRLFYCFCHQAFGSTFVSCPYLPTVRRKHIRARTTMRALCCLLIVQNFDDCVGLVKMCRYPCAYSFFACIFPPV
jgi:hypothetical protein